jgi:hypothetical protein
LNQENGRKNLFIPQGKQREVVCLDEKNLPKIYLAFFGPNFVMLNSKA